MEKSSKTPLVYYGGKQTMLKDILPLIPGHNIYTEAYAGGASVLFAKTPVKLEVINDLNGEIINFYRVCKLQPEALKKEIEISLHSRELHEHSTYIFRHPSFFNPVQRAWAVWFALKISFSAQIGGGFSYDKSGKKSASIQSAVQYFIDNDFIINRIKSLTIENTEATKIIKTYDTPETFHFIDPPYVNCNQGHYSGMFNNQSLQELLAICASLQGKFMLTMYPNDVIKSYAIKNNWTIHEVNRIVTAARNKTRKQVEWMVCNY